jgi:hypothetical protein
MAQNFIACDREQELLLPPSLREWLPEDHFAWFVLDAVEAIDLTAFLAAYRHDGWGRAEPSRVWRRPRGQDDVLAERDSAELWDERRSSPMR